MKFVEWFRHAFALDGPESFDPTSEQRAVVDKLCAEVVRRRLTTPALMMLEMCRPLNFLGAQALHFFAPMISAVTDAQGHRHLAELLEHRGSVDYLCARIEALEDETTKLTKNTKSES